MDLVARIEDNDVTNVAGRDPAYLSKVRLGRVGGFALSGAAALDRSDGDMFERWPSSVTTVTDLRL